MPVRPDGGTNDFVDQTRQMQRDLCLFMGIPPAMHTTKIAIKGFDASQLTDLPNHKHLAREDVTVMLKCNSAPGKISFTWCEVINKDAITVIETVPISASFNASSTNNNPPK